MSSPSWTTDGEGVSSCRSNRAVGGVGSSGATTELREGGEG